MRRIRIFFAKYRIIVSIVMSILIGFSCYFTIKLAVDKEIDLVLVPVAKQTITENALIKSDMIEFIELPSSFVNQNEDVYTSRKMVGMYLKPNNTIYKGSLFVKESIVKSDELNEISNVLLKENEILFQYNTEGIEAINYLTLGNYIDIYFTSRTNTSGGEAVVSGILVENARIIQMLNKNYESVFESKEDDFTSYLSLALNVDDYDYVLKALEIGEIKLTISFRSSSHDEVTSGKNVFEVRSYLDSKSIFGNVRAD